MKLLFRIRGMLMAIKDLIQPKKGMYYFIISHKIDDTKPIRLREKSILKSIKTNNDLEMDLERSEKDNATNKKR